MAAVPTIVKDSFGHLLRVDTGIDLTGNTSLTLIFSNPSGTETTKTGADTGTPTDGIIEYTTLTTELNVSGLWKISARVQFAAGDHYSEPPARLMVYDQFEN